MEQEKLSQIEKNQELNENEIQGLKIWRAEIINQAKNDKETLTEIKDTLWGKDGLDDSVKALKTNIKATKDTFKAVYAVIGLAITIFTLILKYVL